MNSRYAGWGKLLLTGLLLVGWLLATVPAALADKYQGTLDVFESKPALQHFFESAYGYAVFPVVGKGGFFLGITRGKGRVYRRNDARHHVLVGQVTLSEVSIGLQLGGQAFSEVIFLQDERAFKDFIRGGFEFDATASATVITAGVQAQAGTIGSSVSASVGPSTTAQAEYGYKKGVAVFVHVLGGLMYEMSIGGQKFKYKPIENQGQDERLPGDI